ncbi:MAG: hypothetical protein LBG73_04345 [Spirochaetaceae bacterium]|jgi:uncharacterized membrane protein|nr:hypothetical protein [Spirochaetaceae bacterium]
MYWYQKNLRFLQTVLREIDIIDYDASSVADYMKRVNANVLVVNAGGVIDFFDYPNEMANRNRFYKEEILPRICDVIHKAGMYVIARVDFRGPELRRYNLHPDWVALDQDGNPRIGPFKGANIYKPCYNSRYTGDHAEALIDYLLCHYDIDGIWENSLGFDNAPCYCKNCRDAYRAETGKEIPRLPGGSNDLSALDTPAFSEYRTWKAKHADMHIERMRKAVKKYGEQKAFCAEIFDLYSDQFTRNTGIDHHNAKKSFDFIVSCAFLNKNHTADSRTWDIINNSATTIRFSRALAPQKQPVIVTGGNGTRWRYVKDPIVDHRLWMWQIASVGGGIWNCYFNGQHPGRAHDRRAAYSEQDIYTYLADNSELISNTAPVMDVAIYYSNATRDHLLKTDEKQDDYGVYIRGIERVLLEHHIQYGFIPDSELSPARLEGVKALLLPNTAYISDRHLDIIRDYARNGGGLIASRKTSLFDEKGNARGDFGLADVLGVHYTGILLDTADDTYQLIRDKENPILKDVGDTDILINGGSTMLVTLGNKDYRIAATHIPTIPNQPPEYAWIPDMKTDYPTIVSGRYGKGKTVYFANAIESLSFLNGHDDYTEVYKNALDYVTGGDYVLNASAPRSVQINVIADQNNREHYIVALINTTGVSQRPLKELVSAPAELRIPLQGRLLKNAKTLWGRDLRVSQDGTDVLISTPALHEFASVEILLEKSALG